jgi:hypothetical protein
MSEERGRSQGLFRRRSVVRRKLRVEGKRDEEGPEAVHERTVSLRKLPWAWVAVA